MSSWTDPEIPVTPLAPLAPRTTWKIGGSAEWLAEPRNLSELARLLADAERARLRMHILGNGSNLLVRDERLSGVVIHLAGEAFQTLECDPGRPLLRVGAGVNLGRAVAYAADHGLAGLEPLAGVPGTVGGAVMTNAGSGAHAIGPLVRELGVVDSAGRFNRLGAGHLFFSYRRSNLDRLVITDAVLRLRRDNPLEIRKRMDRHLLEKKAHQPLDRLSAGCVFRNPPGDAAGRLVDAAGLKGFSQGDAVVSEQHANFFINRGAATCIDMLRLIEIARCAVAERFGVQLELEIRLWM